MKTYRLNPAALAKWIRQNNGVILDSLYGSLLDDLFIECKRGAAVIKETFVNTNMSTYTVYFSRNGSEISGFWEDLKNRYIEQYGPIE